jgi:hypothetical protein
MDSITLLRTAVVLFAIAAAGGLVMAGIRFVRQINPPAWLSMVHGLLAASALTLVLLAAFTVGVPPVAKGGLVLLVVAAAGGAFLNLGYQWKQRLLPSAIVVVHAALAVTGFACLLVAAFAP